MNPGVLVTLSLGVPIVVATIGFIIRYLLNRVSVAEALAEARQETIDKQARQIDRLEITAQIQDKFFSQLPRTLDPGSPKPFRGNE